MERPKINFISYMMMMYQSGLIALGKIANPITKKMSLEADEARSIIELIEILEEKTKGNLTSEEDRTLKMVLDNLRLNFVEETGKGNKGQGSNKKDGDGFEVH